MPNLFCTVGCNVLCPNLPFDERYDWDLDDPTGKADDVFKDTIQEIEKNILSLKAAYQE